MKFFAFFILLLCCGFRLTAQPDFAKQLIERYQLQNGFKTTVIIQVDVPGIVAPTKTIEIYAEKGKAPKIKGSGLILLPKKGFVEQFTELLSVPVQWILLESSSDYATYKLVALDPKCDWVTADLKIYLKDLRIDEINLITRESGEFRINHFYGTGKYPDRTEISFSTTKFSIPLKFLGKSDGEKIKDANGKVNGKIKLEFSQFETF